MSSSTAKSGVGKARLIAGSLVLVLLLAGAAIGVSVDRMWVRSAAQPDSPHWKHKKHRSVEHIVARFREQVNLTDDQAVKVSAIFKRTMKRAKALRMTIKPKFREAHQQAHKEILAILRGDQIAQYKKLIENKKRRMHHMHKMKKHHPHHDIPKGH